MTETLVLGAVAYDPKVVTIWDGFRTWFRAHDFDFDYVLFSNYERQVEAHLDGTVDVAWNSPLAWVRTRRLAAAAGRVAHATVMRDTDQDLTSLLLVRADDPVSEVSGLAGYTIGTGAVDSPQATLLPLAHVAEQGLNPLTDTKVLHHDVGVGMHGDHIGGERESVVALLAGVVDVACVIDGNHLAFTREGTIPAGAVRVLSQTAPYDHCTFTALDDDPSGIVARFSELLLGMSFEDPVVRPLLELESLTEWRPGRTDRYAALESAVDLLGFYDHEGNVTAADYSW